MAVFLLNRGHALSSSAAVEILTQEDFVNDMVKGLAPPPGVANACRKLLDGAAWDNRDIPGSVSRFLAVAQNPEFVPTVIMFKNLCQEANETWQRAWKTAHIMSSHKRILHVDDDDIWGVLQREEPPDLTIFHSFEEQKIVAGLFESALS